MASYNPFTQEWHDCLSAHYQAVIAENDVRNESSLRLILEEIGFDEAAIAALHPQNIGSEAIETVAESVSVSTTDETDVVVAAAPLPEGAGLGEATLAAEIPAVRVETLTSSESGAAATESEVAETSPALSPAPKGKKKPKQLTLFG